jgi:hypothetical protein
MSFQDVDPPDGDAEWALRHRKKGAHDVLASNPTNAPSTSATTEKVFLKGGRGRVVSSGGAPPLISWLGCAAFVHLFLGIVLAKVPVSARPILSPSAPTVYDVDVDVDVKRSSSSVPSPSRVGPAGVGRVAVIGGSNRQAASLPPIPAASKNGDDAAEPRLLNANSGQSNDGRASASSGQARLLPGLSGSSGRDRASGQSGQSRLLSVSPGSGNGDLGAPRGISGDGASLSGMKYDWLANCVRNLGGLVTVTVPSGHSCTYSASRGGWINCSSEATEANVELGRRCR